MNSQEIAEMHLQSTGMSWDRFPAAGKFLEDLDFEKIRKYILKNIEKYLMLLKERLLETMSLNLGSLILIIDFFYKSNQ
jgi:predicted HTH transcriptional regulator